jgi:O-antigen/teichoic acid export membrane protein
VKPLLKEMYKYLLPVRIITYRLLIGELYTLYTTTTTTTTTTTNSAIMVVIVMMMMLMTAAAAAVVLVVVVVVVVVICNYKPCSIKAKIQQKCEIIETDIKEIIVNLIKSLNERLQFPQYFKMP